MLEALVQEARERLESTRKPPILVAADVIDSEWRGLKLEERKRLASVGLAQLLGTDLGGTRWRAEIGDVDDASDGSHRPIQPPRVAAADSLLWNTHYLDAEGSEKPIITFNAADLSALIQRARGQVAGWKRLQTRAETALSLLKLHKVEHVFELPDDALREIEEA